MSPTLTVAEIWRFPVKSMGGERLKSAEITELGITGDRGWGIFDVDTGTVLTARRAPELLFATASIEGREVIIDLPDGGIVRGTTESTATPGSRRGSVGRSSCDRRATRVAPTRCHSTSRTTRTG